ncbi:MAG: hypothetical protein PHX60_12990 [Giesbergeria sp.]|uniref:hypothetical protein n=1 Tax=Giesbergeria sp. TaxID=2818473 RepID=UPI002610F4A7|nr:hypothetical protein [Giesbergeria sp.]MDD2610577.1 hypothetical protein [Giesbergeria sp.]
MQPAEWQKKEKREEGGKKAKETKQHEKEKTRSEKAKEAQAPNKKPADALSPHVQTRSPAGFSLEQSSPSEAGTIDASQAQQAAQLSRTQMVRGTDAALTAQARRLSPNVLVLLY